MPNNLTLSQILRRLQDRAARTQHQREQSGWGYEKAKAYDEGSQNDAEAQIAEAIEYIIGQDEKSRHVKEYACPLVRECGETSAYWRDGETTYCSQHGRKMKVVEYDEQQGDDWDRNKLRNEQRTKLREFLESSNDQD